MATTQTDGTSPVTSNSTDNNGGTIKANGSVGGTFQSSQITQPKSGVFGSTVIDNDAADKALDSGTFAYDNERPIAKKTTVSLAEKANDFLLSGAAVPGLRNSIHKINSVRTRKLTTAIRNNKWNEYSGEFDAGFPEVSEDVFATDNAANPTKEKPGEFVYRDGSPQPITDDYKEKTN
jgi:hypothetical protein